MRLPPLFSSNGPIHLRNCCRRLFTGLVPLVFAACGGLTSDLLATGSDQTTSTGTSLPSSPPATPGLGAGNNWLDLGLLRADVTSDSQDPTDVQGGVPISVALTLMDLGVDANGTTPLKRAQVDLWHANAVGDYSGDASVRTAHQDWLRGYQVSDQNGQVTFASIFPAGSPGRTPHLNVRVRTFDAAGTTAYNFTTELYFDPLVASTLLQDANYTYRTLPDVINATDSIFGGSSLEGPITSNVGAHLMMTGVSPESFHMLLLLNTKDTFYTGSGATDPNAGDPNGIRRLRDPKRLNISSPAGAAFVDPAQ